MAAKARVEAGIAVMVHVDLTPQAISVLGGFRPQGKNMACTMKVVETALALQEARCFSVVLECVPAPVAAAATSALRIPTIGSGAGPHCSGQVLVYHDLLGMLQHPHHAKVIPKFCKQYAQVGDVINKALLEYKEEVTPFPVLLTPRTKLAHPMLMVSWPSCKKWVWTRQLLQQLLWWRRVKYQNQRTMVVHETGELVWLHYRGKTIMSGWRECGSVESPSVVLVAIV